MTGSYRTASTQLYEGRREEGAQENSRFSAIYCNHVNAFIIILIAIVIFVCKFESHKRNPSLIAKSIKDVLP